MNNNKQEREYIHIAKTAEHILQVQRKRACNKIRTVQGFKQIIHSPLKLIPFGLLAIAFIIIYPLRNKITIFSTLPMFIQTTMSYIISALIVIYLLLMALGLIRIIGTPKNAKLIDERIAPVFAHELHQRYCPILVSIEKDQDRITYMFYSTISIKKWKDQQDEVVDALEGRLIEELHYGGKKRDKVRYIVIHTSSNINPVDRGKMYDDEL